MKLILKLSSHQKIVLKKNYSYLQQAFIYNLLDHNFAQWLHERGFVYEKRTFKLFTFSNILERGQYNPEKQSFLFPNEISFILSTPVTQLLEQYAVNSAQRAKVRLGDNDLWINSIEILPHEKVTENKIRVNTLSPVEVHSTFETKTGAKKTYYYHFKEPEFTQLIQENIQKKWAAFYQKDCPYSLIIYPVQEALLKKQVFYFDQTLIQGWKGHFWLEGEPEILQFALDSGLGSRNSQGCGCMEKVRLKS